MPEAHFGNATAVLFQKEGALVILRRGDVFPTVGFARADIVETQNVEVCPSQSHAFDLFLTLVQASFAEDFKVAWMGKPNHEGAVLRKLGMQ